MWKVENTEMGPKSSQSRMLTCWLGLCPVSMIVKNFIMVNTIDVEFQRARQSLHMPAVFARREHSFRVECLFRSPLISLLIVDHVDIDVGDNMRQSLFMSDCHSHLSVRFIRHMEDEHQALLDDCRHES